MAKLTFKGTTKEILNESNILIIEDDRIQSMMLRQMFENFGFKNIYEADDGQKGWDKTIEIEPDLVILDINMPIMNGFEYCKTVRSHTSLKDITILVQTGLKDLEDKAKIFESGATDYITKPVDFHEVASRSFIHLERALHIKKLESFSTRVRQELQSAKQVLELTLPSIDVIESLRDKYHIDLAAEFKSSNEMGGDLWGLEKLNNHQIAIYCLDFSGHGMDSALNAIRAHSIISTKKDKSLDPSRVLFWLNNVLVGLLPVGNFATMFYGVIDTKKDTLTYATASSTSPVMLYNNSFPPTVLRHEGFPLGAVKNATYETNSIPFKPGDTLILYSDALLEAECNNGELLGEDKLVEMFKVFTNQKNYTSRKSLDVLLKNFYKAHGQDLNDDLTVNVYHRMRK
jgi:sigma-B regulation protein RsbU (phosphoserine phosphatase)